MKILNLYCGLGGNRKLWGDSHEITAVELNPKTAEEYGLMFPKDKVVVGDAHQYLVENFKEYEDGFIWSSPPCQTHSRTNYFTQYIRKVAAYPSMQLYEEVIFLKNFCRGKYCVENVISYYDPLIKPQEIGRHYFWANFMIPKIKQDNDTIGSMEPKYGNKACQKPIEIRNMVDAELGLHILNRASGIIKEQKKEQGKLF